ncbi:thioester domain-containing protein [Aeromicrobium yanjiei]|uniref:Uncharacterized protein n=1 Tax=Aeromicrobium yanjiei TaxID=2662028 RepID=A0A5Q2MI84_9ACTN|nr:thioester domain-containing protein [Aeromicrobium yanjiei]QGG41461.1 hypothetical protein GEV26_08845 [Aeromicrobium yanjiei]
MAVKPMLMNRTAGLLRVFVALIMLGGLLLVGSSAHAEPIPTRADPAFSSSPFTELQIGPITGALGVSDVDAYDAPSDFDPLSGYPTTIPGGWDAHNLPYAGLIPASDSEGNDVLTYCIDLFTTTQSGVTYERGDWNDANVRNLGYVAYILQNYYPTEPDNPPGVANNVRSAAVQSAIWFFSDNLVLDPNAEPELYDLTSDIVADAIANGPATEPAQPSLSISPESADTPSTGEIVGPFTVTADGPSVLRLEGVEVFTDQEGTQPVAEGETIAPGTQLWARSSGPGEGQGFSLRRAQTVRESTVYLYDGATPGRDTGQKLILARESTLEAVASVRTNRFAAGGIEVTKTISGEGAGLQGAIEITIVCTPTDGDPIERTFTIPEETEAGPQSVTYTGLPAGATCTVTETEDGDNGQVNLTASSLDPETVTIVEGTNSPVAATNEYERAVGELQVTKVIEGPAAGAQDEIVLAVDCDDDGDAFDQELTVPAESPAGTYPVVRVTGIPAGTECRVTETASGATDTILLDETTISPESVTIADSETSEVTITNSYSESEEDGDGDGGGGGDQSGGGSGGGGPISSGFLPGAGAPGGPLTLGIALLVAGAAVLVVRRRMAGRA